MHPAPRPSILAILMVNGGKELVATFLFTAIIALVFIAALVIGNPA